MPKSSNLSAAQIKSIRASLNRQVIAVNRLLATETDPDQQVALAQARSAITRQQIELNALAAAYAASNLEQSEAEQHLVAGTQRIRSATAAVKTLTKLLEGVATVANIFRNLFAVFA